MPDLEKFIEPVAKLIAGVDASGLSLFAGVRAEPLPTDSPAMAYRLINSLRELRGCYHIAALVTFGLTGLQATLAGKDGDGTAKMHGWMPPYPDCSGLNAQRMAAEEATNMAMARAIAACLSPTEMNTLATETIRIGFALN